MCGIFGIVSESALNAQLLQLQVNHGLQLLQHRGADFKSIVLPDGDSFIRLNQHELQRPFISHNEQTWAALGVCRLAITGIQTSNQQPLISPNGLVLAFNGQIYNHQSIAHLAPNASDTEALLDVWQRRGVQAFAQMDGMWAFAMLDTRAHKLILARDRTGVKPLYYCKNAGSWAFASEEKALLPFLHSAARLHHPTIVAYLLHNQLRSDNQGFFVDIHEVPPSHFIEIDLLTGNLRCEAYYSLPKMQTTVPLLDGDVIAHTKNVLQKAILTRMPQNLPTGLCLSGGLDSASIAAIVHLGAKSNKICAYTAQVDADSYDEFAGAQRVAQHLDLSHRAVRCSSADMVAQLPQIIAAQGIPLLNAGTYLQWKLYAAAKEDGVKVMLNGQGSDELFAGYAQSRAIYLKQVLRQAALKTMCNEVKNHAHWQTSFSEMGKIIVKMYFPFLQSNRASDYCTLTSSVAPVANNLQADLSQLFMGTYLQDLLRWDDRCSMAHTIESRVPMADYLPLVEYVFSLPDTYKLRDGYSKWLLRKSVADLLPSSVVWNTRKLGFSVPPQWYIEQLDFFRSVIDGLHAQSPFANYCSLPSEKFWKHPDAATALYIYKYSCLLLWNGGL